MKIKAITTKMKAAYFICDKASEAPNIFPKKLIIKGEKKEPKLQAIIASEITIFLAEDVTLDKIRPYT
ncbi:hypothetical protein RI092_10950 [Lactococcus cremoris]|uniref:hypothetical protein n=1 Tax=Lactococcus lactis subsp. cremoris TaxID=1359 RepID=UPI0028729122|nr:hypothetical protein [Lactococcus cremoris]MDR9868311.1 hypothetical protein [Lactococcus cremoris]